MQQAQSNAGFATAVPMAHGSIDDGAPGMVLYLYAFGHAKSQSDNIKQTSPRSGLFVPSAPNGLFGTEECCRRPKLNLCAQSHIYHSTFHTMTEGQAAVGPKGVQAITDGME